jgi:hypothetical protein
MYQHLYSNSQANMQRMMDNGVIITLPLKTEHPQRWN